MERRILDKINTQNEAYTKQLVQELNKMPSELAMPLLKWVQSTKPVDITKSELIPNLHSITALKQY